MGRPATRDDYIGRMYNITRNTNLNYDNCDWANYTCQVSSHGASKGPYVMFLRQLFFASWQCLADGSKVS
jgi:hypothetical protein